MEIINRIKNFKNYPAWFHILVAILLSISIWLCYKDCLSANFQLDDGLWIVNNHHVHMKEFDFKKWVTEPFKDRIPTRWFAMMTVSLTYFFVWLKPYWYRLTNVIIHMGSAFILYLILLHSIRIIKKVSEKDGLYLKGVAFFGALAWALHPLQTSAVTYVIQRMSSLAGMFYLAALGLYILGRDRKGTKKWMFYGFCIFVTILALGTKETSAMIPAGIFLYVFYFYWDLRFSRDPLKNKRIIQTLLGFGVLIFVIVLWKGNTIVHLLGKNYGRYDFDMYQRLLSQPRILIYYLSLIFWPRPHRICTDPSFIEHSTSLWKPWTTIPSFFFLAFFIYLAYALRRKQKLLSFGMFWLLLNLLVEQTIIPLQLVYHHRLYLPGTFLIGGVIFWGTEKVRSVKSFRLSSPGVAGVTIVVALLGFSSYLRNDVWNSAHKLWEAELKLDPDSGRIMINLSKEYLRRGMNRKALAVLYRALETDPDMIAVHLNMATAYRQLGQYRKSNFYLEQAMKNIPNWSKQKASQLFASLAINHEELKEYEKAEKYYLKALEFRVEENKYAVYYRLSKLYYLMDRIEEAIRYAKMAVEESERFYKGYFYLGSLYAVAGSDYHNAREAFLKALGGEQETNLKAYKHLASLEERQGNLDEALKLYKKALSIEPRDANSLLNIGTIFAKRGDGEEAEGYYKKCIETGDLQFLYQAYFNMGRLALERGDGKTALTYLNNSYNLNSAYTPTLYMLGNLYVEIGEYEKGKELLAELLQREPEHPKAELVKKRLTIAQKHLKIDEGSGESTESKK